MLTKFFEQDVVEALIAMVEAKFTLVQMQQEGMLGHTSELVEAAFSKAPERFDTVDMSSTLYELVVAVVDAIGAVKAHIHQPIVATLASRINHCGGVYFAPNNALQGLFRAAGYNFRVRPAGKDTLV